MRELVYKDLVARGKTLAIAKEWSAVAAQFEQVCGFKKEYTRADVTTFLVYLRKRKLLQTTIEKDLKAIKLLSQIQDWDFPKLSLKRTSPDDIKRPTFDKEHIRSLIMMGKALLNDAELCYLALSTTYGLRRVEMARLSSSDLAPNRLTVHTAKGGRATTHLIPAEVAPYLKAFKPCRDDTLTHMFHRIMIKTGIKATGGYGWHSIRRALATELVLTDASALNVLRFLRWADASTQRELGMLAIYAKKDQERIDEEIFKIHPFLPYWGDVDGDCETFPTRVPNSDFHRLLEAENIVSLRP